MDPPARERQEYTPTMRKRHDNRSNSYYYAIKSKRLPANAASLSSQRSPFLLVLLLLLSCCSCAMGGWIDVDTPLDKRTVKSLIDGSTYDLVMSDEFNVPNRTFKDGHDPVWTALDKSDDDASSAGGGSMQFYNSSAITTTVDGMLEIRTYLERTKWTKYSGVDKEWKHYQTNFTSGMLQSWNKFCFTGGIVEVDVMFPGNAFVGGLWPAVWMLGNLGRATYEASTNNIWPWSYDKCNRELQQAQSISACNAQSHYGMHPHQGRGATEIDIVEVMTGDSQGPLPGTDPPIELPYADMTLQVAPGVPKNRPQSGAAPLRNNSISPNGQTEFIAQTWYEGLEMHGNTSINPFFYGTYLAETKPNEPVTRSKKQAFQADAVGAAHQLTTSHFQKPHTFRLEWQPGPGGRLDWFVKGYRVNATTTMVGDGDGDEWVRAYTIKDKSIRELMGSQIPMEPSYLIMNVAVSSTWGFPYAVPDYCTKCYDCSDPKCACSFYPGFCKMVANGDLAMYVDSVRVYQSSNDDAHVGAPHTLGCDPPDFPTKEWIRGHEYRYSRGAPWGYKDKGESLQKIQRGGGKCRTDDDCGGNIRHTNWTEIYENTRATATLPQEARRKLLMKQQPENNASLGRGQCTTGLDRNGGGFFRSMFPVGKVCSCQAGFTGPHCLSLEAVDDTASAYDLATRESPFHTISWFEVPVFMLATIVVLGTLLLSFLVMRVLAEKRAREEPIMAKGGGGEKLQRPVFRATEDASITVITGTSV